MTLTGKPSVIEPRPSRQGDAVAALRPLQDTVASIRERLRQIEAEVNALVQRIADLETTAGAGASADLEAIQIQINSILARLKELEESALVDWYVNGVLVATRRQVNFIQAGGITISGADDGDRANITLGALVDLLIPTSRGALRLSGRDLVFQLGRFIDVMPASLVLTGRDLGLSLTTDTLLAVQRGALRFSGRTVGIDLTQDIDLAVQRAALRLTGRNIDLSADIALSITRGRLRLTGRDVAITTFDFFRDFADLTTNDLTVYQGTVDASSGELVGTPTSGAVHERVYFDLLPTGSPTDIAGAWEIVVNLRTAAGSTLNGIVFNTQGDNAADGTLQNGYWLDTLTTTFPRLVRFISGAPTVLATAGSAIGSPVELRVTYDGIDTFHCEADGVALFSDVVDSNFTHGRIGLVFFANPGTPGSVIDIGVNYTP
jgi:uncharacterized coiled-coil protein SlyX